jgi:hypothetical protein
MPCLAVMRSNCPYTQTPVIALPLPYWATAEFPFYFRF